MGNIENTEVAMDYVDSIKDYVQNTVKYVDCDALHQDYYDLAIEARNELLEGLDDRIREVVMDEYSDEYIDEKAWWDAYTVNMDMKKYLNNNDHRVFANFNNIDYDYHKYVEGVEQYDMDAVRAMIERLNNNEQSERAEIDRKALTQWYWDTVGSFGYQYNIKEQICELIYSEENREEYEYVDYEEIQ